MRLGNDEYEIDVLDGDMVLRKVGKTLEEKMDGKVKWFAEKKGYGFVKGSDGKDYFIHYSNMKGDGFKNLQEAQDVKFIPSTSPKGLVAKELEAAPF